MYLYHKQLILTRLQRDILLYTGTYEILTYKDSNNTATEIFLWHKKYKDITKAIPAPLYYFKIIYDEEKHEGVAFLGLNNPHSLDVTNYPCENVCDQISWLEKYVPDIEDEEKGQMTCCSINELADVIDFHPNFTNEQGESIKTATLLMDIPDETE